MVNKLSPERKELAGEALELRRAGYVQEDIANFLNVPQRTISYWFSIVAKDTNAIVAKEATHSKNVETAISNNPITLYQGKYEDIGKKISKESVDLIITDPPYVVA